MSWIIRTAVHKANLSRIRSYAGSVVQHAGQAVVGGAKLFHGQIGSGNAGSFQQSVKRLEELAISSTGDERVLMLRGWLDSIREVETFKNAAVDAEKRNEEIDESTQRTLVLYQDIDQGGEPLTFLDVFLRSEALEGIALSMILEAPNDKEAALILEIFGHCLMGGKDVHNAVLGSILDLAKVFSCYHDEALMKRDELLQFAQSSISGLKINANQARIDVEVTSLKTDLMKEIKIPSCEDRENSSQELNDARTQATKEALSQVRIYSKLKALLLRYKDVHRGDSPEAHDQKIGKLKILLQSLDNSSSKAEKMIEDHRRKRADVLSFRVTKENEVCQVEKDLLSEIEELQKQKDALEAQLKKVNGSLAAANGRLQTTREEKQHFDKASTELLNHLESRELELAKSVAVCKTETDIASSWISFIESTWRLQCNFTKQRQEIINAELGKYAEHFVNLSMQLLPAYKSELSFSVKNFEEYSQKLQDMSNEHPFSWSNEALPSAKRRRKLEEEYLDLEAKLLSAFSVVESIKHLLAQSEAFYRNNTQNIQELINDLEKVRDEFESFERPDLRVETPTTHRWRKIAKKMAFKEGPEEFEQLPNSKLMPHQHHEHHTRHRRVVTVDGQELMYSEQNTPHKHQDEEGMNDNGNKYNRFRVIDGQELLGSDDELTAIESELLTAISCSAARDLNDWEV